MKKSPIKKAQAGKSVKASADSSEFFNKQRDSFMKKSKEQLKKGDEDGAEINLLISRRYGDHSYRQSKKGKPGYSEHGYSKFKPESPKQQIEKAMKKKMQAGGVVKSQPKRVGPVDPDGAWTKVQERNLPPVNAKTKVSLAPDKELGATKMMKKGGEVEKAKGGKWIQKATSSIKKRGTEGKCTPISKPGCTGRAKSLAKTFKKMAKARSKK